MSGVLSKDAAAIGGRSGCVMIAPSSRIPAFCAVGELIFVFFVDLLHLAQGSPRRCNY